MLINDTLHRIGGDMRVLRQLGINIDIRAIITSTLTATDNKLATLLNACTLNCSLERMPYGLNTLTARKAMANIYTHISIRIRHIAFSTMTGRA
jgi:hypothetical protein